jgi:ABC-type uncharacterized transport system ATPase subunit
MIHRGRKVLDEATSALRRQFDRRRLLFEPLDPDADLGALAAVRGVERVDVVPGGCELRLYESADPAEAIRAVAACIAPARVELARIRLEDVFVRMVTGGGEAAHGEAAQALRTELAGHAVGEAVS